MAVSLVLIFFVLHALIAIGVGAWVFLQMARQVVDQVVDQIERESVGPVERDEIRDEIRNLLRRGQNIDAVKLYRERTGVGLKEAKDAIEEIIRRMR